MATEKKILNDKDYKGVMSQIDHLMAKGCNQVSKSELSEIRKLSLAARQYEQNRYEIDPPATFSRYH